ncbi:response regulator [Erythrobacter sp. NFXS35]|uniref:response regulator n=1 Tax=Erythrobacter sp. NFXS35 TaxID=2818436 RepID=UPI0032DF594D
MTALSLSNCRILLVEDEYLLAAELRDELQDAGATVVGPAASLSKALTLIEGTKRIDGAVLDVNLRGETAFPAAAILQERKVPTLFVSGYDPKAIPQRFEHTPHCEKPVAVRRVIETLIRTMQRT